MGSPGPAGPRTRIPSKSSRADASSEQSLCASIDAFGARLDRPGDMRRGIQKFVASSVAMRHTSELCMFVSESFADFAEKNDDAAASAENAARHAEALFCHLDTALAGAPGRPKGPAPGTVPACAARSRSRGRGRVPAGAAAVAAASLSGSGPLPQPRPSPAGAGHLSEWELKMAGRASSSAGPASSSAGPAPSAAATPAARTRLPHTVTGFSSTELDEVIRPLQRPPL